MRIALLQGEIVWNSPEQNIETFTRLSEDAVSEGAELLVLPEGFVTGFLPGAGQDLVRIGKMATEFLDNTARTKGVFITGSIPFLRSGENQPRNLLRFYGPDGHLADYAKIFLISFLEEDKKYLSGDRTLTVPVKGVKVSPLICYDLRFAELFLTLAEQTELFLIVANWPEERQLHWETLLVARAIESQCYVAGVNQVGSSQGREFIGGSLIVSPDGEILRKGRNTEEVLVCDIDVTKVRRLREKFPMFSDRKRFGTSLKTIPKN